MCANAVTTAMRVYLFIPLRSLLAALAGAHWRMILYADGVTPGSVLAPDNQRKSVVWYCSFMEFGWKLSFEEWWLPLAFARIAYRVFTRHI